MGLSYRSSVMNTFDEIINEIERIDCANASRLHVYLSPRAMCGLKIRDWAVLRSHGITTSVTYRMNSKFLFCIVEPVAKELMPK